MLSKYSNKTLEICILSFLLRFDTKQISRVLFEYFDYIFQNETDHIKKLLSDSLTNVLFLVDYGSETTSKEIEKENIVGTVMFAVCQERYIVIDLISVTKEFRFKGITPFLINLTQVFGSEKIKADHIDKAHDQGLMQAQTILCCSDVLISTYKTYGF